MRVRPWFLPVALVTLARSLILVGERWQAQIPKVWGDEAVERMTLPIVGRKFLI